MKTVLLRAIVDSYIKELGLIVDGTEILTDEPVADSFDGTRIAHYLMERQDGIAAVGSPEDALATLGATWHVRGKTPFIDLYCQETPMDYIAEGIGFVYRAHLKASKIDFNAPVTRACEADADFAMMIEMASNDFIEDDEQMPDDWPAFSAYCMAYMRRGYRKAKRRIERAGNASRQFWAIADAVAPHLSQLTGEGQQFRLVYGVGRASCSEICQKEPSGTKR